MTLDDCRLAQDGSGWLRMAQDGSGWLRLAQAGSGWHNFAGSPMNSRRLGSGMETE